MIDLSETILSLSDASRRLPARRGGKRPHVSCIYRWTTVGCKGVVLESLPVGGTRCTSVEALERFFKTLAERSGPTHAPTVEPMRLSKARRKQIEQAARELQQAGIM